MALEDRAGVVVEPSGEALVDLVGHTEPVEPVDDRGEMRLVRVAHEIPELRRSLRDLAVVRVLAVEDPQHVRVEPRLAVVVELRAVPLEVFLESLADLRLGGGLADRVHLERVLGEPDLGEQGRGELDLLEVRPRLGRAVAFEAPLPELPIAQELRSLSAEHRLEVEEALGLRGAVQPVLEVGARDGGRALRPQHEPPGTVQRHLEHLLGGDVARLADGPQEHLRVLDDRRAQSRVTVPESTRLYDGLESVEGGRLRGKQVPHPARGLVGGHGTLTIASGVRGGSAPSITAIVIA